MDTAVYSLREASAQVPWSQDIVSVLPQALVTCEATAASFATTGGCSQGRWHGRIDSHTQTNQTVIHVWYTPPSWNLLQQKQSPFWTIPLPYTQDKPKVLLALQTAFSASAPLVDDLSNSNSNVGNVGTCHVYVTQGKHLYLWELYPTSANTGNGINSTAHAPMPPAAHIVLPDDKDYDSGISSTHQTKEETICSLQVSTTHDQQTAVLLGTTLGIVYWVHPTFIPVALHLQLVQSFHAHDQGQPGLFSRLILGRTSSASKTETATTTLENASPPSPVVATQWGPDAADPLVMWQQDGTVTQWAVMPTQASHKVLFSNPQKWHLDLGTHLPSNNAAASTVSLLKACRALNSDNESSSAWHVLAVHLETNRLFWAVVDWTSNGQMTLRQKHELLRFANPRDTLQVDGFVAATDQRTVYAVLTTVWGSAAETANATSPTRHVWIALDTQTRQIYEADSELAEIDTAASANNGNTTTNNKTTIGTLLQGTLVADIATHGVTMLASSGLELRIRLRLPETTKSSTSRASATTTTNVSNPVTVEHLIQHLRFYFLECYQYSQQHQHHAVMLPPSLQQASLGDLQAAIVTVCRQLKTLEQHLFLVRLLQQTALYKTLEVDCYWKLLAIGQELAVYTVLRDQLSRDDPLLTCQTVAAWLKQQQREGQEHLLEWFCMAVDTAMGYREDHAGPTYDVAPNQITALPWTTQCLEIWQQQMTDSSSFETATEEQLQSFCSSYLQACSDKSDRDVYVRAARDCCQLLRSVPSCTDFLFQLCLAHRYLRGLMQIAWDVEQHGNVQSEMSLSKFLQDCYDQVPGRDVETDVPLGAFVLQWCTDSGHYGHVLKYGTQYFQAELADILEREDVLQPYRWIYAVQCGDYRQVTESLLQNSSTPDLNMSETVTCLSMAKLSNLLVYEESPKRRKLIDQKLELAGAQRDLLGQDSDSPLMSAAELLELSLKKLEGDDDKTALVEFAMAGLAVCSTFDSGVEKAAARIWCKIIAIDDWERILEDETDLMDEQLREFIRRDTVFGLLLEQVEENLSEWHTLSVRALPVEEAVFQSMQDVRVQRALRNVTGANLGVSL